jgi:hypothetical protein
VKEINTPLLLLPGLSKGEQQPNQIYMIMQLSPFPSFEALEFSFMASISTLRSNAFEPLALEAKRFVALLSPPSAACLYHLIASWAFASIPTPVYMSVRPEI